MPGFSSQDRARVLNDVQRGMEDLVYESDDDDNNKIWITKNLAVCYDEKAKTLECSGNIPKGLLTKYKPVFAKDVNFTQELIRNRIQFFMVFSSSAEVQKATNFIRQMVWLNQLAFRERILARNRRRDNHPGGNYRFGGYA